MTSVRDVISKFMKANDIPNKMYGEAVVNLYEPVFRMTYIRLLTDKFKG